MSNADKIKEYIEANKNLEITEEDLSTQSEKAIDKAITVIRKIQEEGRKISDPEERVKFYAQWLADNRTYDKEEVNKFHQALENGDVKSGAYQYKHKLNDCRLFIEKKGACQQYAVALAMLCYGDPEIDCYQVVMAKTDNRINKVLKHSADYVRLKRNGEVYKEGIIDPVNLKQYEPMWSTKEYAEEYADIDRDYGNKVEFIGMAYYVDGLDLKDIFMIMQSFGKGIKFDFEGYEQGRVGFMEAYDQKRLETVIGYYQEAEEKARKNTDNRQTITSKKK